MNHGERTGELCSWMKERQHAEHTRLELKRIRSLILTFLRPRTWLYVTPPNLGNEGPLGTHGILGNVGHVRRRR